MMTLVMQLELQLALLHLSVSFSLEKIQPSARLFKKGVSYVVNVLPHHLSDLAWQFAKSSEDKCAGVKMMETMVDAPRLSDSIAHFVCRTHTIHEGGDHIIVIGEIVDFNHSDGEALVFCRGSMHRTVPL
jgi:flavin reductase (DIM6/NTAB) family NADH-FMN oxidoreductase RutF